MKRVTYKSIIERQKANQQYGDLPQLKEILVQLSVANTPKVVRKLRLIGWPIEFTEYNNKKKLPDDPKKTKEFPFPDADKNRKITRIGHEDPSQCPWKKMGYVGSKRYAQRCLEEQEDGRWVPKILCKGASIFNQFATWEAGRIEEDDETLSTFLGGLSAPAVKITAVSDTSKLGGVDYRVSVGSKDMKLTEEMINSLRAVREPSADELNAFRAEYQKDLDDDSSLPEWHDWYEYSHDIRRIFKHTPPMEDDIPESTPVLSHSNDIEDQEEDFSEVNTSDEIGDAFADANW